MTTPPRQGWDLNSPDWLPPISAEEKRRAALTICQLAPTPDDARVVLDALGLLEALR